MTTKAKRLAILASKGDLDWGYHPLIFASTAAALGYEVEIFYTLYGLECLKQKPRLELSSIGNPAHTFPLRIPVIVQMLPGVQKLISLERKLKMRSKGMASYEDLREICISAGVKMVACKSNIEVFGLNPGEYIEDITFANETQFFEFASEADIILSF